MLVYLSIRNFAIVDELRVDFGPGFTVLTGETGAGKSILINALHLILGGRAFDDMIRSGCDAAEVQGVFELEPKSLVLSRLVEMGLDREQTLSIRRTISLTGRNQVFVNDHKVNLQTLVMVTDGLVDISGQHEHVGLTNEDMHIDILDAYAKLEAQRLQVQAAVLKWQQTKHGLDHLSKREAEREEREDYLRFALGRIDQVAAQPGEEQELEKESKRLANAEKLALGVSTSVAMLYEKDGSVVDLLGQSTKQLSDLAVFEDGLSELAQQLEESLRQVEDCAYRLRDIGSQLSADPARLEVVQQRLIELRGLMRSYGPSLEDVFEKRALMQKELDSLTSISSQRDELTLACEKAHQTALMRARELSAKRNQAAGNLSKKLGRELASVAMKQAHVAVQVEAQADMRLSESGLDQVRFLFCANPGEALRPLAKVASGGELSRVLLALKSVLARVDSVATYVFDEVDSGVGGAIAQVLGQKLKNLSRDHQVLCITHLAQIASLGDVHFSIHKQVQKKRTSSKVLWLQSQQERIEEIARMLGGQEVTLQARSHAQAMLESSLNSQEAVQGKTSQGVNCGKQAQRN